MTTTKVKITELPPSEITTGMVTVGVTEQGNNVKVPIGDLPLPSTPSSPDSKFLNGNKQWDTVDIPDVEGLQDALELAAGAALTVKQTTESKAIPTTEEDFIFSNLHETTNQDIISSNDTNNTITFKKIGRYQLLSSINITNNNAQDADVTFIIRNAVTNEIINQRSATIPRLTDNATVPAVVLSIDVATVPLSIKFTNYASRTSLVLNTAEINVGTSAGGVGVVEHNNTLNRDAQNSHPINAITGLTDVLVEKADRIAFSLLPYPDSIPTHVNQELKDSENRLYISSGSTSNQDWDRVSSDDFEGIKSASDIQLKTLDTNLDFTVLQWLKCTTTTIFESGTDKLSISGGNLVIFIGGVTTNIPVKELSFITYICSNKALEVFVNGISVHTDTLTDNALISYINKDGECSSFISRVFNFAATADQVKEWYNGGRINEVKLSNDFYESAFNLTKDGDWNYTWTGSTDVTYGKSAKSIEGLKKGYNYKVNYTISNFIAGKPFIFVGVEKKLEYQNGTYDIYFEHASSTYSNLLYYGGYADTDRRLTITINSITKIGCLDEFIPENIQPHKWVNSGINATDIPLISTNNIALATPTKDKPYEEFGITDGAPSEIPDAVLLERLDATNKVIYKSVGTDTAADWKQITNP